MDKKIWIFQYASDIKKRGAANASWYVGWYDQGNKRRAESCGHGARGKNKAQKRLRRIQAELDLGVPEETRKKTWKEFRQEYEAELASNLASQSREQIKATLNHFERLSRPGLVEIISTKTIDLFVASRRKDRGKNPESKVSAATVNKDLRHLKAALKVAVDWEYLAKMPKIRMLKEPEKMVCFVTPEHFKQIYEQGTTFAKLPVSTDQKYASSDWWKALLATAYLTGWRIRELLALRWEDVDFQTGKIITRHQDNKGKRDELVPVHPVVIRHLRLLDDTGKKVFPWTVNDRNLWDEFRRIQQKVGIHLVCREEHKHTEACHTYGFHDFRRAYATENAKNMKPEVLQKMMRHKSFKTTLGYVNLVDQIEEAVKEISVPEVLKRSDPNPDLQVDS